MSVSEDGSVAVFNAKGPHAASSTSAAAAVAGAASSAPVPSLSSTDPSALLTLPIPLSSSAALPSPDSVPWSDDVLVARTSLDDAAHLLMELRGRVDELTASNDYQLRLHEMNYSEKVKEVAEKYTLQLEHDRSKVEMIADEKAEMEAECAEKLRSMAASHHTRLQAEDRGHQQSLLKQIAHYAQLQDTMQQQTERNEQALHHMREQHAEAMERLHNDWSARVSAAQSALDRERRAVARVRVEYGETKEQSVVDQDAEMEAIKGGYSGRLLVERDSLLRFKGEVGIMKKKLSALHKDIEEQKEQLKHSSEREESLHGHIQQVEQRIGQQRASMKEKDRAISDSERQIAELKKDNGELEKFKFVLDYQIKQLKRQIEPREADISAIKQNIQRIDRTLETDHSRNGQQHEHIAGLQREQQRLQAATHLSRDRTRRLQRRFEEARRAVGELLDAQDSPALLDSGLHNLHRQLQAAISGGHWTEDQGSPAVAAASAPSLPPASVASPVSPSSSSEVASEFGRQRSALLHKVSALSSSASADWREGRRGPNAVLQDNVQLIREIQRQRRQTQTQTQQPPPQGRGQKSRGGPAEEAKEEEDARLQRSTGGGSATSTAGSGGTGEAVKLLSLQRAHIVQLRERLHALTANTAHSPPPHP